MRHRLLSPNGNGKYRPEVVGLPSAIYNADMLMETDWVVIVEGEFKAMVLCQYGFPTIAIPGASHTGLIEKCINLFKGIDRAYIALDPGVEAQAAKIGLTLAKAGLIARIADLPAKPDDMFTIYGCDNKTFNHYLNQGRLV